MITYKISFFFFQFTDIWLIKYYWCKNIEYLQFFRVHFFCHLFFLHVSYCFRCTVGFWACKLMVTQQVFESIHANFWLWTCLKMRSSIRMKSTCNKLTTVHILYIIKLFSAQTIAVVQRAYIFTKLWYIHMVHVITIITYNHI